MSKAAGLKSDAISIPKWAFVIGIGVIITVLGWAVNWYVTSHIPMEISSQLAPTNERVARVESKLDLLLNSILKETTTGTSDQVKTKMTLARSLLEEAERQRIVLNPQSVIDGGKTILSIEPSNLEMRSVSWDTATQFVKYRSYLNAVLYPAPVATLKFRKGVEGFILEPVCCTHVKNLNIEGANQSLDWGNWDNIVFRNCAIRYNGDPIILHNVHFEGCHFQIINNANGKRFGLALLESVSLTVEL